MPKALRNILTISLGLILACFLVFTLIAVALNSSQVSISTYGTIFLNGPSTAGLPNANYYVIAYGAAFYAINGSTQQSFLVNGNAATVINYVISRMRAGQSIVIKGNIPLDASIKPISNILFNLEAATIQSTVNSLKAIDIYGSIGTHRTNVTIIGGHFIGHNSTGEQAIRGYYADKITINGATFESFGSGIAVECQIGTGNVVQSSTFLYNPDTYAIVFNDNSNGIITGNYINSGLRGAGIGIFSYTGTERNCTVSNNTITGWGQVPDQGFGVLWHAIYVAGTPDTKIYDNIISDPNINGAGAAILIKSLNTEVYGNTINSIPGWAIHIYQEDPLNYNSPNGTRIYNNTFNGSSVGGIYISPRDGYSVSNIEISSNTFSNLGIPVMLDASTPTTAIINTLIQSNNFSHNSFGIRSGFTGSQSFVNGLNVLNNTFTSISPYPAVLIESGTKSVTIANNNFSSCATNIKDNTGQASIYGNN